MKYTLLVTQRCNLACDYCYIGKHATRMSPELAAEIVDFAFDHTPRGERVEIGYFGGEPLLEFALLRVITQLIEAHPAYDPARVRLTIATNGTLFNERIAGFLREHKIALGISCDGPPEVQDRHRRTRNGHGSARLVERNIRRAAAVFPLLMVNAVYRPDTLHSLPATVAYLSDLGVRHIYLNPDLTAPWGPADAADVLEVYRAIAKLYCDYYLAGRPRFISLIDAKVAVALRGGYAPLERCRMGCGEFAFTPDGGIYPCERLVGDGGDEHRIGRVGLGIEGSRVLARLSAGGSTNPECRDCGIRPYCMHWCGCSNYFSSGAYDRVGPFLCAAERASIQVAEEVLTSLGSSDTWCDHASGLPAVNAMTRW